MEGREAKEEENNVVEMREGRTQSRVGRGTCMYIMERRQL